MTVYNKVTLDNEVLIDLSSDTVSSPSHIMSGYVGHLNDGTQVTGTGQGGSSVPPWVSSVETVTIGANSVTNTNGVKTYFSSYTPYVAVVLKTAPTTNNQILAMVNNAASALRYRNGAVAAVGVTNAYDAKLVEGTQYDVWHF